MNQFLEWLSRIFGSWKPWVVVPPWDIGVRVRLGKTAGALRPGPHFRIPFLDEIVLVNTRLRIESTPMVTLPGRGPNTARCVSAVVGFRIEDPLKAMLRYNQPGAALLAVVQAALCKNGNEDACLSAVRAISEGAGIVTEFVYFSENVEVRTYRLIQGGGGLWSGANAPPTSPVVSIF